MNDDIVYIPETESFRILSDYAKTNMPSGVSRAAIAMTMDLLKQILFRMYKITDYGMLVKRATTHLDECQIFSVTMAQSLADAGWAKSTCKNIVSLLRRTLLLTAIPPEFVEKLRWIQAKTIDKHAKDIPAVVRSNDAARAMFTDWAKILRETTNNKSSNSIKGILAFYHRVLGRLGANDTAEFQFLERTLTRETVDDLKLTQPQRRWMKILVKNILKLNVDADVFGGKTMHHRMIFDDDADDDGSDKHRLTAVELDCLYDEVKKDIRDELIYLLFVTTGMRIGGLVRIRLNHVAEINGASILVKPTGRTLEKGSKWFTFVINRRVSDLISAWIKFHRPNNGSSYLFPGRGESEFLKESTVRMRFHRWCKKSGLVGRHLHPHSLRHSYAHLLLEAGNDIHDVSKLMGHSSIATTEMFYLKESSAEVAKRANIPWLNKSSTEGNPIPKFLVSAPASTTAVDATKEHKRRMKNMAKIATFVVRQPLNDISE